MTRVFASGVGFCLGQLQSHGERRFERLRRGTDDQRNYLRVSRAIVAEEVARSGFSATAKEASIHRITKRFPYVNPTGIKDIVEATWTGFFRSFPNQR